MAERATIIPYKRSYVHLEGVKPVEGKKISPFANINTGVLLLHIVAFLLGRGGILDGLTPFGIGFYTALSQKDRKYGPIGITILLGIATSVGLGKSLHYGVTLGVLYILFQYVLDIRKMATFKGAFIGSTTYMIIAAISLSLRGFYLYDFIMIAFEGVVIFTLVYISSYTIPIALQNKNRKILSTEEIICVSIITALALSGMHEIYVMGLSIKNILGILLTILFAFSGGGSVGAAVGVTLGLITSMSTGSTPVVIAVFAFSGLLAGILKDLGKVGAAFGFLMGNIILTFYTNGLNEIFLQLGEVVVAFFIFLALPNSWMMLIEKFCNTRVGILNWSKSHSERTRKLTHQKLIECAKTFDELSLLFEKISQKREIFETDDMSKLIDKLVGNVCNGCGMKRSCWDHNFNATYQAMFDIVLLIEEKGGISLDQLPEQIRRRCIRQKSIMEKVVHLYELSYLNMAWKERLIESRELVGQQLKSVGKVIDSLAKEVDEIIEFDVDLEDAIYVALDKAGLSAKNIMVSSSEKGRLQIVIDKRPCNGRHVCTEKFVEVASSALGTTLVKKEGSCTISEDNKTCSFTLIEENKYKAYTKTAVAIKDGNQLCGDSYTFMELGDGQYMKALSDGMGTGEKAHIQSSATIEMLEKMMQAGFNREIAIKTINSMLLLRSNEEMFSSLDMTLIDLYSGRADFVKRGSAPSYIKRSDGKIEEISSSTLPIGILSSIQLEDDSRKLEDGDIVITLSDGVLDSNKDGDGRWVVELLRTISTGNPQEIADNILHRALQYTDNKATDDLTVLVTKVWEAM